MTLRTPLLTCLLLAAACGGGGSGTDAGDGCAAGTEACACAAGDRCGTNARGEQLKCQGGVCEAMSCPAGDPGCVCRGGGLCTDPGATCTGGFCVAPGCLPGAKSCTCLTGACEMGLICFEGAVCIDAKGHEGGACLDNGRCNRGNRCDSATGVCVHCESGTAGCACNANNACSAGLQCSAGLCLGAAQLPPQNPKCWSACTQSVTRADGTNGVCTSADVIEGCLSGTTCTQGSCLAPGEAKPSCSSDDRCPFFQVCLQGGCYSNCDANADCPSGMGCDRHACRPTCVIATGQAACPSGTACTADDGQNGFCRPVGASATASASPLPVGGLEVPVRTLELTNVKPQGAFVLVPKSSWAQDITVRKLWHESTNAAGVTERVEAPTAGDGGTFRACDPLKNECPLSWLSLKAPGAAAQQAPSIGFRLQPGCVDPTVTADAGTPCPSIEVSGAGNTTAVSWRGALLVTSNDSSLEVQLSYVQRPDGQWRGSMYYFGTFGNLNLEQWATPPADKNSQVLVDGVHNALIQRWSALRLGNLQGGWAEFLAVLTSTREGSWDFANVKSRCARLGVPGAVCYPYTTPDGVTFYVNDALTYPVPTGISELPIAMNLKVNPAQPDLFEGRVVSATAMHYPGNPGIKLQLQGDPSSMAACSSNVRTDCVVLFKDVLPGSGVNELVSKLGGRYPTPNGSCSPGYVATEVPWLVSGFQDGTVSGTAGGVSRYECRDAELPFDAALPGNTARNTSLAGANPVPDGQPRVRTLRFLDGALVNQTELFILFEERFSSFVPSADGGTSSTSAYGFMRLERAPATLKPADYQGLVGPASITPRAVPAPGAQCEPQLINALFPSGVPSQAALLSSLLGSSVPSGYLPVAANTGVHYFCQDTGQLSGGPSSGGTRAACPAGSKVTFFNVCPEVGACTRTAAAIAAEACQTQYTPEPGGRSCSVNQDCNSGLCVNQVCSVARCGEQLQAWRANGQVILEGGADDKPLLYACTAPGDVYCDDDRLDLRAGKQFYRRTATAQSARTFVPLPTLIETAFRYRTRFKSSVAGTSLGFAPQQCRPGSDALPYCYDPVQIDEARKRVDCLVSMYSSPTAFAALPAPDRTALQTFLQESFSVSAAGRDGFERLYAELLVMQGDEALTSAYASRFDLAAAGGATFRGSQLEPGGIDLTGVAGSEMYNLYLSVQLYQLALDRLYKLGPNLGKALSLGTVGNLANFVTAQTVTSWLQRLVRAASQKSRAFGEIARRYQNFDRPDLARRVIERAYVATYLESALINRLMLDITERAPSGNVPQLRKTLADTQRNYRMALLDMREVFQQITDETNYFGYPADYIPFPALDNSSSTLFNAYEVISVIAKQRLELAKTREGVALTFGKQGKVDAAQFQAELATLRNNYENQLAALCGTFTGDDGRDYPGTRKYAPLNRVTTLMGDPCGRTGNGELFNALANVKLEGLKMQRVQQDHTNKLEAIKNQRQLAARQCAINTELADLQIDAAGAVSSLQSEIDLQKATVTAASAAIQQAISSVTTVAGCVPENCIQLGLAAVGAEVFGTLAIEGQFVSDLFIAEKEEKIRRMQAATFTLVSNSQCDLAEAQMKATIKDLFNESLSLELEALSAEYAVRIALANVQKLASNARRLEEQQVEAEQLAIDVQAAQNDPNVRIYQNDAVINADVSFNAALAAAYRLTRVFEYYTSQSYAKKEQLFLIRMVTAGQYNLENYLLELDNEFNTFEEQFGNPDLRVLTLSLRDDILKIPYSGADGKPLSEEQRKALMRERLRDVRLMDANGYLTLPFTTTLKQVSPLTRNHKIRHVEIDLHAGNVGDQVARVYLRMNGTGVVNNVQGDLDYFVFPSRLAVVNAATMGNKVFDPESYRNYRFRDRPLVNTMWELVINQRDELANQDIDLQTLSDIRVVFYYSDFTSF